MHALIRLRSQIARSGFGRGLRRLGLHRPLNWVYGLAIRRQRRLRVELAGRPLEFRMDTRREAARIVAATGEMAHIESICDELGPGDVFYDIGANIGMFTCAAASAGAADGVRVEAFEPEPRTAARLRENIELNGLTNARAHEIAASDADGELELIADAELGAGTHSLVEGHSVLGDQHRVPVKVRAIAPYAEAEGLAPPTLVKCDVEGAEARVIRGLTPWLTARTIRRMDVEFHIDTLLDQGESAEGLEREIIAQGYEVTQRSPRGEATVTLTFRPAPQGLGAG